MPLQPHRRPTAKVGDPVKLTTKLCQTMHQVSECSNASASDADGSLTLFAGSNQRQERRWP